MRSQEKSGSMSVVTVAVAAGVSAVVSAIVVSIGVVGMVLLDRGNTAPPQTIVAAFPSQAPAAPVPAPGPAAPTSPAPSARPGSAAPPAAVQPAPPVAPPPAAAPAPAVPPPPAAAEEPPAAEETVTPQAPPVPSEAQLVGKLQLLLDPGTAPEIKARELEAGEAGLGMIGPVADALALAGPAYSWTVVGPVSVDGDLLTAQLKTSLVGFGDRFQPITWIWRDGNWKLTNESGCALAAMAMVPCPA
ncbi:MAG: hypothetical protein AAGC80_24755 [Rhodococcus sp. (in: high G+C Gram-positive bacteria)]